MINAMCFKGACVRLDTTLVDFSEMHWERGDITFLYNGDAMTLHVLDNKAKVYQKVSKLYFLPLCKDKCIALTIHSLYERKKQMCHENNSQICHVTTSNRSALTTPRPRSRRRSTS